MFINIIFIFTKTFIRWCLVSTMVFKNNYNITNNLKLKLYRKHSKWLPERNVFVCFLQFYRVHTFLRCHVVSTNLFTNNHNITNNKQRNKYITNSDLYMLTTYILPWSLHLILQTCMILQCYYWRDTYILLWLQICSF